MTDWALKTSDIDNNIHIKYNHERELCNIILGTVK